MADLVITATSVVAASDSKIVTGTFGETVTAGQTVYQKSTDSKWYKAKANGTAGEKVLGGVALNGGAVNQQASIQIDGGINPGATVTVGTVYVASGNYGGIAPAADLVTGWSTSVLGVGTTTTNIQIKLFNSGAVV